MKITRKKGFTLMELLGVVALLAVISLLLVPVIANIIDEMRVNSYRVRVQNLIDKAKEYATEHYENHDFPKDGLDISKTDIGLKKENFVSGIVYRNEENKIAVKNVYDKSYCASGVKQNIIVEKVSNESECQNVDSTPPSLIVRVAKVTNSSILVIGFGRDSQTPIAGYSFQIGSEKEKEIKTNKNTASYEFTGLKPGVEYEIKVTVKNKNATNDENDQYYNVSKTTNTIKVKTSEKGAPQFKISSNNYSREKEITIIYPDYNGTDTNEYIMYDKQNNIIEQKNVYSKEIKLQILKNGRLVANVKDKNGELISTNELNIIGIDNSGPSVDAIMKSGWEKSKEIELLAVDPGIGLAAKAYSFDGGLNWIAKNTYSFKGNQKLYLAVRDRLGNITTKFRLCRDKKDGIGINCIEPMDLNGDGTCDLNCDLDGDGFPDYNIDTDGDNVCDLNCDYNNDGICDQYCANDSGNIINIDLDGDGICDLNCDRNGDGWADFNLDTDGDGVCDYNCQKHESGVCTLNCDRNGDGIPDFNLDTDGDGVCDYNCQKYESGICILNCDTNGDGYPDFNLDVNGDGICDFNCDTNFDRICDKGCLTPRDINNDGICDFNCDTNGDGIPDTNLDINSDNKCDYNCIKPVDINGDGICDFNCDTNGDGKPDKNIDYNNDGICDMNCDTNNDGKCDLNCDTNNDGLPDTNLDTNKDGICDYNCTKPVDINGDGICDFNCDTNGDGKPDKNIDYNNDGVCDMNCDTNNDGTCDLNCDTNGDGIPDTSLDTNKDGVCDMVCLAPQDINGDGICDFNCDTNGDKIPDLNIDLNNDGVCDMNCDTNKDGICDRNCDTNGDHKCDKYCVNDTSIVITKSDIVAPSCEIEVVKGTKGNGNWYRSDIEFSLKNVKDEALDFNGNRVEGSGIKSQSLNYSQITTDGKYEIIGTVIDAVDNKGTCRISVARDTIKPTISVKVTGETYSNGYKSGATVTPTCTDERSGVASKSGAVNLTGGGPKTVNFSCIDEAGNTTTETKTYQVYEYSSNAVCGINTCQNAACGTTTSTETYSYVCGSHSCGSHACGTKSCGSHACGTHSCGTEACGEDCKTVSVTKTCYYTKTTYYECGGTSKWVGTAADGHWEWVPKKCSKTEKWTKPCKSTEKQCTTKYCTKTCTSYCTDYCTKYCTSYCDDYCDGTREVTVNATCENEACGYKECWHQ